MGVELARLMQLIPGEEDKAARSAMVTGGVFNQVRQAHANAHADAGEYYESSNYALRILALRAQLTPAHTSVPARFYFSVSVSISFREQQQNLTICSLFVYATHIIGSCSTVCRCLPTTYELLFLCTHTSLFYLVYLALASFQQLNRTIQAQPQLPIATVTHSPISLRHGSWFVSIKSPPASHASPVSALLVNAKLK